MALVLRVESTEASLPETLGADGLVEADGGLTIGRAEDNGLVLRDEQQTISKHHCAIEPAEGRFVLIDRSRNGTFLNHEADALPRDVPVALKAGDVIQIGCYRIDVVATAVPGAPAEEAADAVEATEVTGAPLEEQSFLGTVHMAPSLLGGHAGSIPGGTTSRREEPLLGEIDGDLLPAPGMAFGPRPDSPFGPGRAEGRVASAQSDHVPEHALVFVQPKAGVEAIPDDWDLVAELGGAPAPAPAPAFARIETGGAQPAADDLGFDEADTDRPPEAAPAAAPPQQPPRPVDEGEAGAAIAAFLAACGLSPADVGTTDLKVLMDRAGRMLQHSVAGLHGILSARVVAKQEFGIERTMIERSGNNPLKFVLDAREAMHMLLCVGIPGFMRGDAAVEQAFADIRAHEVAMLAAMQEALQSVCQRLSPASIENAVERAGRAWPGTRKARSWDEYRRVFDDVVSGLENDANRIVGADFARAYRKGAGATRGKARRPADQGARTDGERQDGDVD